MKRDAATAVAEADAVVVATTTEWSEIPFDVVQLILATGRWKTCGSLARTSREWMRLLTSPCVVSRLITETAPPESTSNIHATLPPWLFFALPASLVGRGGVAPFTWTDYVDSRTHLVFPLNLPAEKYFYTGGDVAQRLHDKRWQADCDIWTTDERLRVTGLTVRDTTHDWDFVVKSDAYEPTQRCIEKFDLSVVQQGFLQRDSVDTEPELYATPLAVCSLQCKKLFIAIDPLFMGDDYDEPLVAKDGVRAHNVIHRMILKHRAYLHPTKSLDCWQSSRLSISHTHRPSEAQCATLAYRTNCFALNEFFENCELCVASILEKHDSHNHDFSHRCCHDVEHHLLMANNEPPIVKIVLRWMKRVMKYRNRFADYEQHYVVNPLVRRHIEALETQYERETKQRQSQCDACQGSTVEYLYDNEYGPCHACSTWRTYDSEQARLM
jgi:hypothetical protein